MRPVHTICAVAGRTVSRTYRTEIRKVRGTGQVFQISARLQGETGESMVTATVDAKDAIDLTLKTLALVVGGAWTVLNYFRGRTFTRRLEPTIHGNIVELQGAKYLTGEISVKNVGLTKVEVTQEPTALVVWFVNSAARKMSEQMMAAHSVFKDHGWIEPGETISEPFLVPVPASAQEPLMIRLDLRIVSRGDTTKDVEWNSSTMVPVAIAESDESKTDGKGGVHATQSAAEAGAR